MLTPRNMKYAHREALQLSSAVVALVPLSFRRFTITTTRCCILGTCLDIFCVTQLSTHLHPIGGVGVGSSRPCTAVATPSATASLMAWRGTERSNARGTSTMSGTLRQKRIFIAAVLRSLHVLPDRASSSLMVREVRPLPAWSLCVCWHRNPTCILSCVREGCAGCVCTRNKRGPRARTRSCSHICPPPHTSTCVFVLKDRGVQTRCVCASL
jgi:hypothetical protein